MNIVRNTSFCVFSSMILENANALILIALKLMGDLMHKEFILFLLFIMISTIFGIPDFDQEFKGDDLTLNRKDNYDFFANKSIIVWGTKVEDEDELYVNQMIAEDVVKFRISRWLNKPENVVKVIPDSLLTEDDIEHYNLILVGTPYSNLILSMIMQYTPITISEDHIKVSGDTFTGDEVGVMYRYPNPLNQDRFVWVVSAPSYEAIRFVSKAVDYTIFEVTDYSPNADRIKELAQGDFDNKWQLESLDYVDNEEVYSGENDSFPVVDIIDYPYPEWAETGVMYEIFVRSFADGDGDGIGDLKGLTEKLDYLNDGDPDTNNDLGIKLIWLMPIFASSSYHGYDVSDYYSINPDYGTNEDFQIFLQEAHKRGMKIITDLVLNHCSNQHPFFIDAYGNKDSKYSDWFFFTNESKTRSHNWQFRHSTKDRALLEPFMPAWNVNNLEVQNYLFEMAKYWMDPNGDGDFSDGIDGFRCDYVKGPPREFWKNFRQAVKSVNSDVLLLAENWEGMQSIAMSFDQQFDMAFDFPFQGSLSSSISSSSSRDIIYLFEEQNRILPQYAVMNRFFNNHDMNRIFTQLDEKSAKLGLTILLTVTDMPMLYYGDEIGMKGRKDPYDEGIRRPMEWCEDNSCEFMTNWYPVWDPKPDGISVEEEINNENSILNYVKNLIHLRNENPVFDKGNIEFITPFIKKNDELTNYMRALIYVLSNEDQKILVVCNLYNEQEIIFTLSDGGKIERIVEVLSQGHEISYDEQKVTINCPAKSSFIAELLN